MTQSFVHLRNWIAAATVLSGLGISHLGLAETLECTPITLLPAVIMEQGIYCLTGNLSTAMTSGNAIEIQANNVTIDFNGWKLGGLAAGTGTATTGVFASDRKNITVRNGTVRGFFFGINLSGSSAQGNLIEDIRAEQNRFTGIQTAGRGDIVRKNQVVDTGGITVAAHPRGIYGSGDGARVLNNDIVGVTAAGVYSATGIYHNQGDGAVVESNRVAEIINDDSGATYGIHVSSSDSLVAGNRISGPIENGFYFAYPSVGYSDNKVIGAINAFVGGTDYGGNSP